jgi:hypothetical protein
MELKYDVRILATVAGSFEHGNEFSVNSVKGGGNLDYLLDCYC